MLSKILKSVFGSRNQRVIKKLSKNALKISLLEAEYEELDDGSLRAKTAEFKRRLNNGETLDDLLIEAFAAVREASKRTLGLRHFDVQLIGGMVLHQGKIAEMCTGEGKTLVATLAAYLNALTGKGVHIVTVNDYLAKRDAEWMGPIYDFLGLTVGVNSANLSSADKRTAYSADIVYGTNNEFGFDYLRDNMAFNLDDKVQRDLSYAILDEVDSILIDEARTPLIISGPTEDNSDIYSKIDQIAKKLRKCEKEGDVGDYYLEEKHKQALLTETGHQHIEELLYNAKLLKSNESLYDPQNINLMHHISAALRANTLYQRDVDYIVTNNEVVIVDEHTGRTMPGRRWSDGLHQAVEAKEKVKIQNENQTLATITFQNYFRLYDKLSGMTGTADTEAYEFQQIYNLEVVVVPTNMPLIRKDYSDKVYLTMKEKFKAVVEEIRDCRLRQQPVLVGTASIETSEYLSSLLDKVKIPHQVLNAKHHEKEAKIIAQAGVPGTVTIATNMAGRGTDIVLGGSLEMKLVALNKPSKDDVEKCKVDWKNNHDAVISAGGLHVLGSERHESRRIDNQLRGRSGRQGDPGSSRFYVSLEDNLMRIFAADRVSGIMKRLGMKEGEAIEHSWVSKAIENAQRKVEGLHFDIRKQLLEFDDIANEQRQVVYQQRAELMGLDDISDTIKIICRDVVGYLVAEYIPSGSMEEEWNIKGLEKRLTSDFSIYENLTEKLEQNSSFGENELREYLTQCCEDILNEKEALVGKEVMRQFEKAVMLQSLDQHWKDHLAAIDHLRHSIHLSGYAQKNPKQEYRRESFHMFTNMLLMLKYSVIQVIMTAQVEEPDDVAIIEEQRRRANTQPMHYQHTHTDAQEERQGSFQLNGEKTRPIKRGRKVGRNELCPCGSGKKYKQCCGKL